MRKRQAIRTTLQFGTGLVCAGVMPTGFAQHANLLQPGRNFRVLNPPQRTEVAPGKIEVIEFFWVGCPHCRRMEPIIEAWKKLAPDDVQLRKVHVNFRVSSHQQLFYTLVAMNEDERLIEQVFDTIHDERNNLASEAAVVAWAKDKGLDGEQFQKTYRSFGVKTAMNKAERQINNYGVDSVPALAVGGRYYTAPSMAGSNANAMRVVDALIQKVRSET